MAPFRYDTPEAPLAGTIADIILRGGDIRARQAQSIAETQARSTALQGANWGRAVETLSQVPAQLLEQNRRDKLAESEIAYRTQQMQGAQEDRAARLQQRQRQQAADALLGNAIRQNTDPETGAINAERVASIVGQQFPEVAGSWLDTHAKTQNALETLAKSKRGAADAEDLFVANAANDATSAADFVARVGTAASANHLSKPKLAQIQAELGNATEWDALKQQYVDRGDQIAARTTVKEGEQIRKGVSGALVASLPKTSTTKTTSPELKQDQFAKTLYGPEADRTSLTLGDWQKYDAQEAAAEAAKAAAQHQANRNYDNAHPAPPPAMVALNDNQKQVAKDLATGALTYTAFNRMYSSRSGQGGAIKEAIYGEARTLNPAFNPAQFEAGYKMATNPQMTNRLVAINGLMPVVDMITTLAASAGNTDMPGLNRLVQEGNFQIGGKRVASLRQLQTLLGEEVGNALGVGSASDLKTKLGLDLVNITLGPKEFLDTMQQLRDVLGSRKDNLLKTMGVYGQPGAAVPVAQPSGGPVPASAAPQPTLRFNPATGKVE